MAQLVMLQPLRHRLRSGAPALSPVAQRDGGLCLIAIVVCATVAEAVVRNRQYRFVSRVLYSALRAASATRGCAPLTILLILYSLHLGWALITFHLFDNSHIFDLEVFDRHLPGMFAIMLGAALLLQHGFRLYRRQQDPVWFQHLAANYYALAMVWAGYLIGAMSLAAGVVLVGAPLLGFLVLRREVVLYAFITAFISLLIVNSASAFGLIPYAPVLLSPTDQNSALLWVHSQLLMAAPHLIVDIYLAYVALGRWRQREANVLALSLTDSLTGVANRRSIVNQLDKELARSQRQQSPLCIAIMDVDLFKQINDRYGHATGDQVLRQIASTLAQQIRSADSIGRFGGEEFLLVLPETTLAEALVLLERCRHSLVELNIQSQNQQVPVSASFGIAWCDGHQPCDTDTLLRSADQALYTAKADGRNCLHHTERPCCSKIPLLPRRQPARRILQLHFWVQQMNNILEWSAAQKMVLVGAIALFMGINFWLMIRTLAEHAINATGDPLINLGVATLLSEAGLWASAGSILLMAIALLVHHFQLPAHLLQVIGLHSFSQTLVLLGHGLGIFYLPTGIMLLCLPIMGFILFDRAIVLQVFTASLVMVIALGYAAALEVIPYAPLIASGVDGWQASNPPWLLLNYYFTSFAVLVVFALAHHILGRWRERENQIRHLSQTDMLTLLPNRHSIMGQLEKEIALSQRQQQPFALAILDLDHFKQINDRFGHPAGDKALRAAAAALRNTLRAGDAVGRFGGEEFLLILHSSEQGDGVSLAERCRAAIHNIVLHSDDGERIPVSASIGVVTVKPGMNNVETLLKVADDALYHAKDKGRNRITVGKLQSVTTSLATTSTSPITP